MALLQDVYAASNQLQLTDTWSTYKLTNASAKSIVYILLKDIKDSGSQTIDKEKIIKVGIEIGIDSGVNDLIIPIKNIDFDFRFNSTLISGRDERTSIYLENTPLETFYFRVAYITTHTKTYYASAGVQTMDVALNINELHEV